MTLAASHAQAPPTAIQEPKPDRALQRQKWFRRGRALPDRVAAKLLDRAYQQKIQNRARPELSLPLGGSLLSAFPAVVVPQAQWRPLGPAPMISRHDAAGNQDYGFVSGRATALAVDQSDPTGNTVYAGGAFGGVWKSTNATADSALVQWRPLLDDQPTLAVGAIALRPKKSAADPDVVLVGTGESNSSGDSYYGLGIYRSADAGNTWTLIRTADNGARGLRGLGFAKIAFSTDDPDVVVAAAAAAAVGGTVGAELSDANRGLYYSTDAGQSWSYASVRDENGATPDPGSATSVIYHPAQRKFYAALRLHGIYSSPDGVNWTRLATQPGALINSTNCPASPYSWDCPLYRSELAVVPGRDEMYAWMVDADDNNHGIFQSINGGASWTEISSSGIVNCGDSLGCGTDQGTYNLALLAIPNGDATDLYAGGVNLYRCRINAANPLCQVVPFANLTHVYGCSPIGAYSHVHPDQHALDFSHSKPQVMYIANDGGVYRTVNSFAPAGGVCGAAGYPFDNLNQTLGSMTQFVWFSQHPTDSSTLLGGTQDNGSPAVDSAHWGANGLSWLQVNDGDGGFNDINPGWPLEWFTSNNYVSIYRCANGIACNTDHYLAVIGKSHVGGDSSGFYTPWMLDPKSSNRIIVGTCRVWRGPSDGTGWSGSNALSMNFDSGVESACLSSARMITALAAGGPVTASGSQVVYAGTESGRLWVTSNADGGPGTWADRTAAINPGAFPISSIAVDPADATGRTAYVAIMGFTADKGGGHIYKTSDAGVSWTDINGNLPDAPADSVLVDPGNSNVIYVGADVGVFSTSDGGATWTEVGPPGGAGSFPNVAVTALRIFSNGATKKLRAATYGRGLWEIDLATTAPDFGLAIANPRLTIYPGQQASLSGTLTSFNGYSKPVTISCGTGKPGTCAGVAVTPTPTGTAFALAVSDPNPAAYTFLVHAADADGLTHQQSVQVDVVDFVLGTPSPVSLSIARGQSAATSIAVTGAGPFDGKVSVTCGGLPGGASCNVNPNTPFQAPTTLFVTVDTLSSAPLGTHTLTISATAEGAPAPKTQDVAVSIAGNPDFALAAGEPNLGSIRPAERTLTGNFNLTSLDGFAGALALSCSVVTPGATCSVNPQQVTAFPAVVTLNVFTTAGMAATSGAQTVTVTASEGARQRSAQAQFTVLDYTAAAGGEIEVHPGGTANAPVTLSPLNGYAGSVKVLCDASAIGASAQCTLSQASPVPLSGAAVQLSASVPVAASLAPGAYALKINTSDADYAALAHNPEVTVRVTDFKVSSSPTTVTVRAGVNAIYTISVAPLGGYFNAGVSLQCGALPSQSTCTFTESQLTPGGTARQTALTIRTTAPVSMMSPPLKRSAILYALFLPGGLVMLAASRKRALLVALLAMALALVFLQACGGGGGGGGSNPTPPPPTNPGTPPGTYTLTVTGTSGTLAHPVTLTLVVQ